MSDLEKRVVYTREDGFVSVVCPSPEFINSGKTIDDVALKDVPVGCEYTIIDVEALPDDETYFNAWQLADGKVVVNLEKAQQIAVESLNRWAKQEYLSRAADESIGLEATYKEGDDFATVIKRGREAILASDDVGKLSEIVAETEEDAKTAPLD